MEASEFINLVQGDVISPDDATCFTVVEMRNLMLVVAMRTELVDNPSKWTIGSARQPLTNIGMLRPGQIINRKSETGAKTPNVRVCEPFVGFILATETRLITEDNAANWKIVSRATSGAFAM